MNFSLAFEAASVIGGIAFALSGYLIAARKHLDVMGVFIIMMLTANGGGAIRDVLINVKPQVLMDSTGFYISVTVMVAAMLLKLHRRAEIDNHLIFVICDSIGLVAFGITGTLIGIQAGLTLFGVMVLAFITAAGGGMLRDIVLNETPSLLSSDFYGTVALLVAVILYVLAQIYWLNDLSIGLVFAGALLLRLVAFKKKWRLPRVNF